MSIATLLKKRIISTRAFSSSSNDLIKATLFPGDGIGPEIAESLKQVFTVAKVPIEWEPHQVGSEIDPRTQSYLTWESIQSMKTNKFGLKGPMATPVGKGHRSLNLTLRQELGLYANVRPCYSLPGYKTRYDNVDLVTIRENTEGEYSGIEHEVVKGVVESLKIISRKASTQVAEYAFEYAKANGRNKVSAIHKANIMRKSDGLFLQNLANPTALLLSGVMMLRHRKLNEQAERIHNAIINTIAEGKYRTADLGGSSTTTEFTNAICDYL